MADEIYIKGEEFAELCRKMIRLLAVHRYDGNEQRSSMNNVYSDVQETEITENYTLAMSMIISMTEMCFEMMKKSLETFKEIGGEMQSVDALMESCVNAIISKRKQ